MNKEPFSCLRCDVPMEEGFLIDMSHVNVHATRWTRGRPQKGWWDRFWGREATYSDVESAATISAHRCPQCGVLELHAPDVTSE